MLPTGRVHQYDSCVQLSQFYCTSSNLINNFNQYIFQNDYFHLISYHDFSPFFHGSASPVSNLGSWLCLTSVSVLITWLHGLSLVQFLIFSLEVIVLLKLYPSRVSGMPPTKGSKVKLYCVSPGASKRENETNPGKELAFTPLSLTQQDTPLGKTSPSCL